MPLLVYTAACRVREMDFRGIPGRLVAALTAAAAVALAIGCQRPARHYQLKGQIIAVDPARQELTIKHQDIPGFMPGMTMAFKVWEPRLIDGRVPGELVTATLIVKGTETYLRDVARTGFSPVIEAHPATRVRDLLQPGEAVRDAPLVDETGARQRLENWRGRTVAVTFIYTRCPLPNFCPLMDRHFKAVQEQVRADPALRGGVQLLSVSFDPEHDQPAILAKHAAKLEADPAIWHFLTGNREDVEAFAAQFGVSVMRENPSDEIVHNLRTAIIDGEGKLITNLSGSEWAPADLVAEIRRARARR
jgi:protein SCO1